MPEWICPKCGFDIKTRRQEHLNRCDGRGPKRKIKRPNANGQRGGWNKGLKTGTNKKLKERYNSGELSGSFTGKKHSAETKAKIAESRKQYLLDNPDKVPYVLNHYSKGPSYPEIYWIDLIRNENLDFSYHKRVGLYELDFFNEEKMIDFEVDGEQHYVDENVVESDGRRTEYLKNLGWKVIRLRWSEWQKKTDEEKKDYVNYLRNL
jgi:very-short-patch-repair endonuclease